MNWIRFSLGDLLKMKSQYVVVDFPGRSSVLGTSIRKTGSFVRPISPKSPVASASAFESVEESDDDDNMTDSANLDASYLQANGDMVSFFKLTFFSKQKETGGWALHVRLFLQPADANEEQISMAASSMIRSHSVSGDLHGVQPDPIAADILRKEPEQETFVRLNVPLGKNGYYFFLSVISPDFLFLYSWYSCPVITNHDMFDL